MRQDTFSSRGLILLPILQSLLAHSLERWKRFGPELGVTPANYVCGCGAGATPGKLLLDTSPWKDAKNALTWDGLAATPGCG